MTSARTRTLYGRTDYTRESVFLRELDSKLMEGDSIYEKKDRRTEDRRQKNKRTKTGGKGNRKKGGTRTGKSP